MPRLKHPVQGTIVSVGEESAASMLAAGWVDAEAIVSDEAPAGNASRDEWEAYALSTGRTEDDLEGLSRNEIRDLFA